jgi:hypothetical protein
MVIVPVGLPQAALIVVTATAVAPPLLVIVAFGAVNMHPLASFTDTG